MEHRRRRTDQTRAGRPVDPAPARPVRAGRAPALRAGQMVSRRRAAALGGGGWFSEAWQLRRRRLFLMPGDSPIGFRLPLDSLPYVPPVDEPFLVPADPFAHRRELPEPAAMARTSRGAPGSAAALAPV